jgi:ribosomal-protein-alanine N-acetyltransferase
MTTLATARLLLGPHCEDDAERLHRWENDAEILEMMSDAYEPTSIDDARKWIARWTSPEQVAGRFAVRLADTGEFVGYAHLGEVERDQGRCKLGYLIGEKAHWGRGYATEAVRAVVAQAFGPLGLHRVQAGAYATNPASIRVLEKVGFRREGVLRESVRRGEGFIDEIVFGLLRPEWIAAGGAR